MLNNFNFEHLSTVLLKPNKLLVKGRWKNIYTSQNSVYRYVSVILRHLKNYLVYYLNEIVHVQVILVHELYMLQRICGTRYSLESLTRLENP